jgi:hypothetical protein
MLDRRLPGASFMSSELAIISLAPFFHHIVNQLGDGYAGPIGRVDFVDIKSFWSRELFFQHNVRLQNELGSQPWSLNGPTRSRP